MAFQHSAGCSPFFSCLWWESFKHHTAATFLRPQKVSWIFFDLIWCTQKSVVPISSLLYHHHRTCRPLSCLGQLVRGEQRRWSKTKILQERCMSDGLYTSYCLFLFQLCRFNWILVLFVNQISKEPLKISSVLLVYKLFNVYCIATSIWVLIIAMLNRQNLLFIQFMFSWLHTIVEVCDGKGKWKRTSGTCLLMDSSQ